MIVFKAGGSAITDKSQPYTARTRVMEQIAKELMISREQLILAHGVGSYGHPPAKTYQIGKGDDGTAERKLGLSITRYHVEELSLIFLQKLIDQHIPAIRLQPAALFTMNNRRISGFFPEPLQRFLDLGFLPVLFGDGPVDRSQGFCVLSADQTIVFLAKHFKARKILFGMDVPGILDQGTTIPHLFYHELDSLIETISENHDASGGLKNKLQEIKTCAGTGITVQLISLLEPNSLAAAIRDEPVGTLVAD